METPDLVYAIGLPPRDAVAYLESKGVKATRNWYDVWQEAQAKAFTVAGLTQLELLQDIKAALVDALKNGKTERTFTKELIPILRAKGWTGKRQSVDPATGEVREKGPDLPARLSLIFTQNVQSAYMYGRYTAMLANADERPWWMYVALLDSRTRPHHRALHRKVFRYDDPFWKTHYPPNGFRCRCRTRALSNAQLKRENLIPEKGEGHMVSQELVINPYAPENQRIKRIVWGWQESPGGSTHWTDIGFSYNPGVFPEDALGQKEEPRQRPPATNWKELGLRKALDIPAEERLLAPELLPKATDRQQAVKQLAEVLGFTKGIETILVKTPLGERTIRRDLLPHMVEKEADARERFSNYILPTLKTPFEVWLKEHDDGKLRENYIGLYSQAKYSVLVVIRINADGSLFWNFMHREDKKIDKLREGWLVWQKKN